MGVEMIAPHKQNRKKPKTQDGRRLRRYRRRWKEERLFAWLHNFRRLPIRYEYHAENFCGIIQLGSAIILLRWLIVLKYKGILLIPSHQLIALWVLNLKK